MRALAMGEWRLLALGTACLALASGGSLVYPQAIRIFMDEIAHGGGRELIDRAATWTALVFVVQGVATGFRYYLFTLAGERIVTRLRGQLYRSIIAQEIAFFDGRRTGELMSRLAADTQTLQSALSINVSMVLRSAAGAVGGLALLLYTSARLTLIMLVIVPPIAVSAVVVGRWVRRYARRVSDALAEATHVAEETLGGVRTVRQFAGEEREAKRYERAVQHAFELGRARIRISAVFQGTVMTTGSVALVLVLWLGGRYVVDGLMTVGELTAFLLYTTGVALSLATLAGLWADFMRALGAGERIFELLDRVPSMPLVGGATLPAVPGELRFEGVRFAYDSRPDAEVLRGIDLTVAAGEVVALVGPSGGGKSTIASLIPRLYDPLAGRVTLDGHDLRTLDPTWLRAQVATVAQEPLLFSTTIGDNITYGARVEVPGQEAIEQAARAANAHEFITRFPDGYRTQVGERGVQLSGGQKQRVAIARAVLQDPRVLVLDEATSALDAQSEHLVQEALTRLARGRTTLIIAHRLSTVMGADRVVVIEHGQVVQAGSHRALMQQTTGLYRRLIEHQFVSSEVPAPVVGSGMPF